MNRHQCLGAAELPRVCRWACLEAPPGWLQPQEHSEEARHSVLQTQFSKRWPPRSGRSGCRAGGTHDPSSQILFLNLFIILYFYFWLRWVFVAVRRLSLVAASGGYSSLRCAGFSFQSTGSRRMGFSSCGSRAPEHRLRGSVVVVHGLSCSATCGIFPDQGSNPCLLHWQADS